MKEFRVKLHNYGITGDLRRFSDDSYLMRVAPIGLYNNYDDVEKVIKALRNILN